MTLMNDDLRKKHKELKSKNDRGLLAKGKELFYTVKNGTVDSTEYHRRLEICTICPFVEKKGNDLYCNECGCPRWKGAKLNDAHMPKLAWAGLACPKGRFGSMNKIIQVATKDEIKNFIIFAKKLADAGLVPTAKKTAEPSGTIDWNQATISYPTDGFLTPSDLSIAQQKMTEAIVNEKWNEGLKFALLVVALLRP